jgi:hypothetical protein
LKTDRKAFNLKSIIAALLGTTGGLFLIVVSEAINRQDHPVIYGIVASIAATLLTAGLLGFAYEFLLRKELLQEFDRSLSKLQGDISQIAMSVDRRLRLADSIGAVGLTQIDPRESHFDYSDMIRKSKKLFFVFNDGRTWFSNHADDLQHRASNPKLETHIVLAHPESPFVESLSRKVDQTADEIRSKIAETTRMIARIPWGDHKITVYGHQMPTSYSLIMNESHAVFIPYPLARKADRIPCFIFSSDAPDGFYRMLDRDVKTLLNATDTDVLHPPQLFRGKSKS